MGSHEVAALKPAEITMAILLQLLCQELQAQNQHREDETKLLELIEIYGRNTIYTAGIVLGDDGFYDTVIGIGISRGLCQFVKNDKGELELAITKKPAA